MLYDGQTRQLVGYFGPHGFRPDQPPADEQFSDVPTMGLCADPYLGELRWWLGVEQGPAVYLIGNGILWRIDVEKRAHTIRRGP